MIFLLYELITSLYCSGKLNVRINYRITKRISRRNNKYPLKRHQGREIVKHYHFSLIDINVRTFEIELSKRTKIANWH